MTQSNGFYIQKDASQVVRSGGGGGGHQQTTNADPLKQYEIMNIIEKRHQQFGVTAESQGAKKKTISRPQSSSCYSTRTTANYAPSSSATSMNNLSRIQRKEQKNLVKNTCCQPPAGKKLQNEVFVTVSVQNKEIPHQESLKVHQEELILKPVIEMIAIDATNLNSSKSSFLVSNDPKRDHIKLLVEKVRIPITAVGSA